MVSILDMHDGVVSHAASRKLDNAGWRYDEEGFSVEQELRREPDLSAFTSLETWFTETQGVPIEEACHFSTPDELQRWIQNGVVDFVEVFCGSRGLTFAVQKHGMTAGEGFDRTLSTYGRSWNINTKRDQYLLYWMILKGLRPYAVHFATPDAAAAQDGTDK